MWVSGRITHCAAFKKGVQGFKYTESVSRKKYEGLPTVISCVTCMYDKGRMKQTAACTERI